MPSLHFTKRAIEAISPPESGQVLYRDTGLRGFGLRVGSQSKVFIVEGQVNRRTKRVTIGRADVISVDAARKRALAILSDMAMGKNPNDERGRAKLTFEQAFNAFLKARDSLAPHTVDHYRRAMTLYLTDWRKKPLSEITRQMVLARHQRIAKLHGKATANNAMRQLRSIYNFTAAAHDEFPPNPVAILTQARAWYPERRRRGVVAAHDFPAWWAAAMQEPDYSRDLLLIALFTGMRWAEVVRRRRSLPRRVTGACVHVACARIGNIREDDALGLRFQRGQDRTLPFARPPAHGQPPLTAVKRRDASSFFRSPASSASAEYPSPASAEFLPRFSGIYLTT